MRIIHVYTHTTKIHRSHSTRKKALVYTHDHIQCYNVNPDRVQTTKLKKIRNLSFFPLLNQYVPKTYPQITKKNSEIIYLQQQAEATFIKRNRIETRQISLKTATNSNTVTMQRINSEPHLRGVVEDPHLGTFRGDVHRLFVMNKHLCHQVMCSRVIPKGHGESRSEVRLPPRIKRHQNHLKVGARNNILCTHMHMGLEHIG